MVDKDSRKLVSMREKNNSVFSEIKNSLTFMLQSAQGKYSLETYLEVLSEFTDSEIISGERSGLNYIGGEVVFTTSRQQDDILAAIELEFQDQNGEWKLKKADRRLEKNMFTQEAVDSLVTAKETKFEIERPDV